MVGGWRPLVWRYALSVQLKESFYFDKQINDYTISDITVKNNEEAEKKQELNHCQPLVGANLKDSTEGRLILIFILLIRTVKRRIMTFI